MHLLRVLEEVKSVWGEMAVDVLVHARYVIHDIFDARSGASNSVNPIVFISLVLIASYT